MTHTYNLIETRISIEAGKIKKKKKNRKQQKKRKNEIVRFPKLLLYFPFLFFSG